MHRSVKSEFRMDLRNNKWLGQEFTVTCNYTFPDSTKPKWAVPRNSPGKPSMCSSATALPTETALHNSVISHFLTAVCIFTHFYSLITSEHAVCSHASNAFIQSNTCNGGNFLEATWGDSLSKQENYVITYSPSFGSETELFCGTQQRGIMWNIYTALSRISKVKVCCFWRRQTAL